MPEHLRALVVVLVLAVGVFVLAKSPACAIACTSRDFERRRNLWLALTLTIFLAHNFWIYIAVAAVLILAARRNEPNVVAMYFFILLALPSIPKEIPGFGVVNYLFVMDYVRLLALTLLLPAYLALRNRPGNEPFGRLLPDKFLMLYMAMSLVQLLGYAPFTTVLRLGVFYQFVDIFLPYYVVSRYLKTLEAFRDAMMSFAVAAMVLSAILFFEYARFWLLYLPLQSTLGAPWGWNNYLVRADNLRAVGTVGHAIAAGYVMAVAMAVYIYLRKAVPSSKMWMLGFLLVSAGLLGPLSRGPWVGAAAMLLVIVATGPAPALNFAKLGVLGVLALPILLLTDVGKAMIDHLPFVGTIDAANVAARQHLWNVSVEVFLQSPLLGRYDYIELPAIQALRGNDGIIDLVNTYVIIGLGGGMVGLLLFLGFFFAVAAGVYKGMRSMRDKSDERYVLGQCLLAAILGVLVIIATVSPVLLVPTLYWCLGGLGMAYARMSAAWRAPKAVSNAQTERTMARRDPAIARTNALGR